LPRCFTACRFSLENGGCLGVERDFFGGLAIGVGDGSTGALADQELNEALEAHHGRQMERRVALVVDLDAQEHREMGRMKADAFANHLPSEFSSVS